MATGSMVFCLQCGSSAVDVQGWETPDTVRVACAECGHEAVITGFSLGRMQLDRETFFKAAKDVAVYKRNPETIKKIRTMAVQEIELDEMLSRE